MAELNPSLLLILTGGEPLLKKDIYELSSYASQKGMMVVLGTNGNMIDDDIARKLKESGVTGIGISLDSIVPGRHDTFRGIPGAWDDTLNGIEACRRQGIEFQIQTTVTKENFNEIPNIIEFSYNLGAKVVRKFNNIGDFIKIFFGDCGLYLKLNPLSPACLNSIKGVIPGAWNSPECIMSFRHDRVKTDANPRYPAFFKFLCNIIVDHIPVCSQYYHHSFLRGIRG